MNAKSVEIERDEPKQECVWKVVIKNNFCGEGTSFDPENLTTSAFRCLTCDGFACDCRSYAA